MIRTEDEHGPSIEDLVSKKAEIVALVTEGATKEELKAWYEEYKLLIAEIETVKGTRPNAALYSPQEIAARLARITGLLNAGGMNQQIMVWAKEHAILDREVKAAKAAQSPIPRTTAETQASSVDTE
jgi:accessory colonization factor AcfC